VLADQRAAIEKEYNATIYTYGSGRIKIPWENVFEYAPVVYQSTLNTSILLLDIVGYLFFEPALFYSQDTGNFTLSPPYPSSQTWRMGAFLPYYGNHNSSTLTTVSMRDQDDVGYIVTVLNVADVFGEVIDR
jgi:hypothetical protein